ncbi:NifB/NifX family molybdenum-iron cluster-binding protein [Candidatus Aerophobetes bacterium]|nr:NifB/NifX family molybdenum-iron cluster-binding protein [Candidatus Aerophobetes bacterium]
MKIAISTDGDFVSAHFGRCPAFTLVEIEGDKVVNKEAIANPGHHPGFLPNFLAERGVEYIICGGMGQRAQGMFEEKQIKPIVGVQGRVDETIDKLIRGELKGGESLCQPGRGKGYGIPKTEIDE